MAHLMMRSSPITFDGRSFDRIWNISHHVGTPGRESNRPTDVELIQRLIRLMGPREFATPHALWASVSPTGHLDKPTMACINARDGGGTLQMRRHQEPTWIHTPGLPWRFSPSRRGDQYHSQGLGRFMISIYNQVAMQNEYDLWLNLPEVCSPALRRELETSVHH